MADIPAPVQHQYGGQSAGMVFVTGFMNRFLHQVSFVAGNRCYDRHCSVQLVVWDSWRLLRSHNLG